jgi:hypothetical protein
MGDYDVTFVGSRLAMTRQQKLQSVDRLVSMAMAIPAFQVALPSVDMAKWIIGDLLELPELAAGVGDQQSMMLNALMMQMAGGKQGSPQAAQAPGMMPEQAAGGIP